MTNVMILTLQYVNFPFLCSKIPLSPAYGGVYISLLIRYARACCTYEDFSKRGKPLTLKLMLQGYNDRLIGYLRFYVPLKNFSLHHHCQ
jgi:hypothetical protein